MLEYPLGTSQSNAAPSMHDDLPDLDAFLRAFDQEESFAYTKINHGFWECLANVEFEMGWPTNDEERARADTIARRPHFFVGDFVDELICLLESAAKNHLPSLHLCFELSAWPGDNRITGAPFRPERSKPLFNRYVSQFRRLGNGLLLKQAVNDGTTVRFFERLRDYHVVLVGPDYISSFFEFVDIENGDFISIHPRRARETRAEVKERIRTALAEAEKPAVVLLQAGTLAPYWILQMLRHHPGVRWVDGGLAFSICHPPDILKRPWGKAYRKDIIRTHNALRGCQVFPEHHLFEGVSKAVTTISASSPSPEFPASQVAFVEEKSPDFVRVEQLLEVPAGRNHWTNRGPLYCALAQAYHEYFGLDDNHAVVPCANGGIALETIARLHDARAGRHLRWVVSAFSFRNLGRGYFADAAIVDCDEHGLLSLDDLSKKSLDTYDGVVVTNPFGLCRNVDHYRDFADTHNKAIIVDNAAGVRRELLSIDYQALSLHHTKPYGVGEGGLAIVPAADAGEFYELIDYGNLASERGEHWLNNGKLSEVACAFHLDRLERAPEWVPFYEMQARRIFYICERAGLRPLLPVDTSTVATSVPYLANKPFPVSRLRNTLLRLGKYYQPLARTETACRLYDHIVNVPCHPNVARVDTEELAAMLRQVACD